MTYENVDKKNVKPVNKLKLKTVNKYIDIPASLMPEFESCASQYSGQYLWDWALYNNKKLVDFLDKHLMACNPTKIIGDPMGCFTTNPNNKPCIELWWHEEIK
jgi:hypothetical protein